MVALMQAANKGDASWAAACPAGLLPAGCGPKCRDFARRTVDSPGEEPSKVAPWRLGWHLARVGCRRLALERLADNSLRVPARRSALPALFLGFGHPGVSRSRNGVASEWRFSVKPW